jgi:hypothetical protein
MPRFRDQLRSVRIKKRRWYAPWISDPWAPTNDEQDDWIKRAEACYTTSVLTNPTLSHGERQELVTKNLRAEADQAGVGPMTWLWIASMVIQLVKLWRDWKRDA